MNENKEMLGEDSDDSESEGEEDEAMEVEEQADADDSGDSDDDSDAEIEDDDGPRGVDRLQIAHGIDIPCGVNIPIVSQLAKEAYKRE